MYFVGVVFARSTQEGKLVAVHSVSVRNTWQLETVHRVVPATLLPTSCSSFISQCDSSSPGKSSLDPVCVKFCYVIIELDTDWVQGRFPWGRAVTLRNVG